MTRREDWPRDAVGVCRAWWRPQLTPPPLLKCFSPPALPAWPVVNDLLTLPLAQRLELVQTLWDSIAAE
ncbi:addiction module protein [Synechococcus sp. 8F6]|uniref:addiction module protein n=1 Tax=Synechococcus sp. 8F6 TaxID=2025606 RepID=UPI00117EAA72|nr:addiction module protein [Synechococcus sp. 8F6]